MAILYSEEGLSFLGERWSYHLGKHTTGRLLTVLMNTGTPSVLLLGHYIEAFFANISDYRHCTAIPYIDELLPNINNRFSEAVVQLLTSSAIFDPASIPKDEPAILDYRRKEMQNIMDYGKQPSIEFGGHQKLLLMLKKQLLSSDCLR